VGEPHPDLELESRANIGTSVFFFSGEFFLAVTKKKHSPKIRELYKWFLGIFFLAKVGTF
jgi:hypothetical protein